MREKFENWYNKNYKKILIIPALLIILSLAYVVYFTYQNNDIIKKDVSLTGGTSITIFTDISSQELENKLKIQFPDIDVSAISDNTGKQTGLVITIPEEPEKITLAIEQFLEYKLTKDNSSVEFTGSSLGEDFYNQLIKAVIFAFLLMALVIFLIFGESKKIKVYSIILTLIAARITFPLSTFLNVFVFIAASVTFFYGLYISKSKKDYYLTLSSFAAFVLIFFIPIYLIIIPLAIFLFALYTIVSVPSIAVILSAFADILIPLAIVDAFGVKISSAGIVAFLMLIGYSVDTDILLTTRVLRRKTESINQSIWGAFKTGTTMTITSIIAVSVALILVYNFGSILNQIFTILIIGLSFDLLNTWITNVSIIKWYCEARGK